MEANDQLRYEDLPYSRELTPSFVAYTVKAGISDLPWERRNDLLPLTSTSDANQSVVSSLIVSSLACSIKLCKNDSQ